MDGIGAENWLLFLMIVMLLPVFFAGGWFLARMDVKSVLGRARRVPRELYGALEDLVLGRPGRAAEALEEALEDGWDGLPKDLERVRVGMILGRLLRDRGECDRAIELHLDLLASPEPGGDLRDELVHELGLDYYRAGLVDRAEAQLEKLLNTSMGREAREALLDVYQLAKDWKKAINVAQELSYDSRTYRVEIAQFYCELARSSLQRSQSVRAREYVQAALHENRACARANAILGDIEMREGNWAQALEAYEEIAKQNGSYLGMVAGSVCDAWDKLGDPARALEVLKNRQRAFPELDLLPLIRDRTALLEGEDRAREVVREFARVGPGLSGALAVVDVRERSGDPVLREDMRFVREVLAASAAKSMKHLCSHCGHGSGAFYWRCPVCGRWETLSANKIEV